MIKQLLLPKQTYILLRDYVLEEQNYEVCGVLSGLEGKVLNLYKVKNIATQPEIAFYMEPQGLYNALIAVERSGQELLAIFHSHPSGARTDLSSSDLVGGWGYRKLLHMVVIPAATDVNIRAFDISASSPIEVPIVITA